jgi:hypothetical protein
MIIDIKKKPSTRTTYGTKTTFPHFLSGEVIAAKPAA